MILTLSTSLNPSKAAFPVSPLVAVKIIISSLEPWIFSDVVNKWGKICKATSLNALVGPWNNSKI